MYVRIYVVKYFKEGEIISGQSNEGIWMAISIAPVGVQEINLFLTILLMTFLSMKSVSSVFDEIFQEMICF